VVSVVGTDHDVVDDRHDVDLDFHELLEYDDDVATVR
jgi:hypothetical protein